MDRDVSKVKDIERMVGKDVWVQTSDIPKIIKDWEAAIDFYYMYKVMGPPFSGGWYDWPCTAVDIILNLKAMEGR